MRETAQLSAMLSTVSRLSRYELVDRMRKFSAHVPASQLHKSASLGGDPETGFEQSFASLGYTYLSDKAPGLLDYLVGFQLVDRNEDNTKAVGVFGFQVGDQWMYVPVFFLSGDMKGHELLYLKNQDMFVPLKENWVNFLINKQPQVLGEGTPDTLQQLGVMQPSLQNIIMPPFAGKYASLRPWAKRAELLQTLPRLYGDPETAAHADAFFGGQRTVKSAIDLRQVLEQGGVPYVQAALALVEAWPGVKEAMDVHYGPSLLADVVRTLQKRAMASECCEPPSVLKKTKKVVPPALPVNRYKRRGVLKQSAADDPASPAVDKVEIITENGAVTTEEDQQKLLRDGQLIKDHRQGEEFTVEYRTQQPMTLSNPDLTGVYDVLTCAGEFEKCLVTFQPYCGDGRRRYVTVIRLADGERAWKNLHPSRVFVRSGTGTEPNQDGRLDWYDEVSDSGESLSEDAVYAIVTASGQGTVPFRVYKSLDDGIYEVSWLDEGDENPGYNDGNGDSHFPSYANYGEWEQPTVIFGKRKGQTILSQKRNLYVPENSKVVKLRDVPKPSKYEPGCCSPPMSVRETDPPPIKPGDPQDLQLALRQKTSELKVVDDHCELIVNGQRMQKRSALLHLVLDHGLSEGDARRLIKEAEQLHGVRWRVQYGTSYPRLGEKRAIGGMGGMGGGMMGGFPPPSTGGQDFPGPYMGEEAYMGSDMPYVQAPMQMPFEQQMQVPGLEAGLTDPNMYNPMMVQDPMAAQVAQQASQTGQKEVFDTAMLSSLTKLVHPDQAVDKDLGNIAKTLNTLGKMLFMFYWHNEEFQDRYGKKDLPELEDTLRNSFEMLGDLLLFLKQKSVDTTFGTNLSNIGPNIQEAGRN